MNVRILLDRPRSFFTNLDEVSGKVVLKSNSPQAVTNITVKLEGESRTRLIMQDPDRKDRPKPVLEVHKV